MKIKNKSVLGYLYNNLDFLIRFVYCKIPFISKILFWKLYASDFKKLDSKFEEIKNNLEKNKLTMKGKTIMELGSGNSFINAYNFLMNGAKKVVLVDKFSRYTESKKQKDFFQNEINFIKQKYKTNNLKFIQNKKVNKNKIQFIEGDISDLKFKSKYDLIISISVLEHVKNIKGTIKKLSEILKPKGLMYHKIDLRDHYNFNKPFKFYKYSNWTWNNLLTKEGVSYTNRLKINEYNNIFKDNKLLEVTKITKKIGNKVGILEVILKK